MQRLMLVPVLFSNTGQDTPNQFYCWECIVCLRDIDNLLPGWGISYHREAVWNNDTGPKPNNNIVVERDTGRRRNHNGWVSDSQSCWCLLPQPEQNRIQDPLELNHITTQTVWRPFFFFFYLTTISQTLRRKSTENARRPTKRPTSVTGQLWGYILQKHQATTQTLTRTDNCDSSCPVTT